MKIKLIDVETEPGEFETGTCELCFGSMWCENPTYIFEANGKQVEIVGYGWSWGDYQEIEIDNIISFAAWLNQQEFPDDTKIDEDWLWETARDYEDFAVKN